MRLTVTHINRPVRLTQISRCVWLVQINHVSARPGALPQINRPEWRFVRKARLAQPEAAVACQPQVLAAGSSGCPGGPASGVL